MHLEARMWVSILSSQIIGRGFDGGRWHNLVNVWGDAVFAEQEQGRNEKRYETRNKYLVQGEEASQFVGTFAAFVGDCWNAMCNLGYEERNNK